MNVTNYQMQAWNRWQQSAAQKKAQAEHQAKVMAVMKPKQQKERPAGGNQAGLW